MKYPFPVVEVIWLDAESTQGWEDEDESDHEIPEVMTIGFLIHKSDAGITVAATACKERTTNNRLKIPAGMVKSIRYLRGAPKAKPEEAKHDPGA